MKRFGAQLISPISFVAFSLSSALSFTLTSCGDDAEDKLRNEDGFCTEWAIEACNTTIVEECSDSEEECQAAQKAYCMAKIPSGTYVSTGAQACIDEAANALVDGRLTAEERDVYRDFGGACERVISGNGSSGDTCESTRDCNTEEELECVKKPGEAEGRCHIPEETAPGDECDGAAQVCADTHFCDEVCRTKLNLGAECSLARPCKNEFKCETAEGTVVEDAEEMGTCVEKAGNGDPCTTDADCTTNICAPNGDCVNRINISGTDIFETCDDFRQ